MDQPVILTVAPNGARRVKSDHPAIPLTIAEIGREAARCAGAGAAMIHVHVRAPDGSHVLDAEAYRLAIAEIRAQAGQELIVQITTEAVGRYSPAEQMAVVDSVRPEACSIAVRELIPDPAAEPAAEAFLRRRAGEHCLMQHILYDAADVQRFEALVARGVIPADDASVLFVLGRYSAGQQSDPSDLLPFLAAWSLSLPWAVCAFGRREAACVVTAAALGGHVRVGFENNLHLPDGSLAADNAGLVQSVVTAAAALGLRPASPQQARAIFRSV
jgi:3-keto-5-aminohexanoate cleavage enzyme